MGTEGADHNQREGDDAAARDRLRLDECEDAVHPLKGVAHGERCAFDVNIGPGEAEDLALPQSRPERDKVEGLESVTADGLEKAACLVG